MNKIVCTCCGESKPEIAFEMSRGKLRKKCRDCRCREKRESHRRCGDLSTGPSFGTRCYLRGFIETSW